MSTDFSGVPAGRAPDRGERAPKAVLWDMDGTLVDTEPYWIATEFELAEKYDATWTEQDALNLVGSDLIDSGSYIKRRMDLPLSPAEVVEVLLDGVVDRVRREVPWQPGARELLADLRRTGVPCALVTMSYARFVDPILAQLPAHSFDAVVTGDQVARGKPHPEPYLCAAEALGVPPEECLAIEDSGTGAASAQAAGCTVLVVPNHVEVPAGERRIFWSTLAGAGAADLPDLLGRVGE
ncbi:MAG: HAD family phosphatase [Nocardioides sp.]|uniref:HAD family hydrolase n=1 Tax=Nocardioides sp. TaxID=35761 RepID=UPI0039E47121